nr:hypothetical protein [Rhizobium leguminosarum]
MTFDFRDGLVERLPLLPSPADHHALISNVAPAEPHEFDAVLKLMAGVEVDDLPFRMEEPKAIITDLSRRRSPA